MICWQNGGTVQEKTGAVGVSCQDLPFIRPKSLLAILWNVSVGRVAVSDYLDGSSELP